MVSRTIKSTFDMTLFAVLLSICLVLHYLESFISIPIAGFMLKIGLSNIVIVYLLIAKNSKEAILMSVCKVVFSLFFSPTINFNNFLISLGGALASLMVMVVFFSIKRLKIIYISIFGGIFHNIGQLVVVLLLMRTLIPLKQILYILPVLTGIGIISGLLVGLTTKLLLLKLNKFQEKTSYNSN